MYCQNWILDMKLYLSYKQQCEKIERRSHKSWFMLHVQLEKFLCLLEIGSLLFLQCCWFLYVLILRWVEITWNENSSTSRTYFIKRSLQRVFSCSLGKITRQGHFSVDKLNGKSWRVVRISGHKIFFLHFQAPVTSFTYWSGAKKRVL